jgi:biofilm PGA synthesis N-glycosyltransferase PgaC
VSELIFVLASLLILYVLAGYPLIVALWARYIPQPVTKQFVPRTVSILIPVRNGDPWLEAKLRTISALDYPPELLDTIVISSASTDKTVIIAKQHAGPHLRVIELEYHGKAIALNAGMAAATGEILFFTDVRQALDPHCLKALVANFADPRVGIVSGELVIREGESLEEANVGLYWKYEKLIRSRQSQIDSIPGATGSICAMRRELASPIPPGTLLDDVYLPLCAFFRGYRSVWEAEAKAFDYPSSLKTEFWRKVRTLAGVYQILGMFPRLLVPNHRLWIHFASHKLGRLIVPYALIAALISSFGLPVPLRYWVLGAQAAFYSLALLDLALSGASPLKRLSSPVGTFVGLMAASACAASVLVVPPDKLWRPTR